MTVFLTQLISYFRNLNTSFWFFLKQPSKNIIFPFTQNIQLFLVVTITAACVYLNTLGHQMANDDEQVIRKNEFVLSGIKGIPDILKRDSYYSFYKQSNLQNIFPGGRYEPLSAITFAIEQQCFATKQQDVPIQYAWDVNGNGKIEPEEDTTKDYKLNEEDFFARGLGLRHFVNIILFALCVGFIYLFFAAYIPQFSSDVIFASCLLFAIHPIHTEVVANIKSRDELLSLFFILCSFIFAFRYLKNFKKGDLILFGTVFFLALLSKGYAINLLVLLPCTFFIFKTPNFNIREQKVYLSVALFVIMFMVSYFTFSYIWFPLIILVYAFVGIKLFLRTGMPALFWGMGLTLCVYFALRWHATADVGNDELFNGNIISNPYLLATAQETIATKLYVLIKYIALLFYPHTLISDYSFNTISYRNFTSWEVWVSILFYASLLISTIILFFKRHPLAFPLLLFWAFMLPISNIFTNIGTTMGERLMFHASLGFCFVITWPLNSFKNIASNKLNIAKIAPPLFILMIVILGFWYSFNRNRDWENNQTLFEADLSKAPYNIPLISGVAYYKTQSAASTTNLVKQKKLVDQSIELIDRGLQQNGAYMPFYQTLALNFYIVKDFDKATSAAKGGLKVNPNDGQLKTILFSISKEYVGKGINYFKLNKKDSALVVFEKAIKVNAKNADAYYNKAVILKQKGDTLKAIECLQNALAIEAKTEFKVMLNKLLKNNK